MSCMCRCRECKVVAINSPSSKHGQQNALLCASCIEAISFALLNFIHTVRVRTKDKHRAGLTYGNANQKRGKVMHKVAHFLPNSILNGHCVIIQTIKELSRRSVCIKECHILLQH